MKKLLTERFQELAGIRPLYQMEEAPGEDLELKKYLAEGKLLREEMELEFFNNDEDVALIANSGEYEAEIKDGKVSFSVVYEDEDYDTDGYVESMGPEFEKGINSLIGAWEEWKMGPMTEPGMIPYAKRDILKYLEMQLMEENL